MAKNMQPIAKRCKALGISPAVMASATKTTKRNPGSQKKRNKSAYVRRPYALGQHGRARK